MGLSAAEWAAQCRDSEFAAWQQVCVYRFGLSMGVGRQLSLCEGEGEGGDQSDLGLLKDLANLYTQSIVTVRCRGLVTMTNITFVLRF